MILEAALGWVQQGVASDLCHQDSPLSVIAGACGHSGECGGRGTVGPGVKVDVLAGIVATYRGNSVACHLGAGEVVRGAGPGCGGRGEARVHKVQSDPADLGAGLVQGVLTGARRVVGVGITLSKVFLVSVLGEKRSSHSLDDV